jgi:ribosome maturation protein SDO1
MVNSTSRIIFNQEQISINTAWMKKNGEHFEVVIDPDKALEFKRTKGGTDIAECLHAERIFSDAKRGLHANDGQLEQVFGTTDPLVIARKLILEGELQLTAEHRARIREAKRNAILTRIRTYAIDPTTGLPHPQKRLELAMEEAKVRIDDNKDAESQVSEIVRKLQPIIPIRLETVTLQVHLAAPFGQKLYGDLQRYGTIKKTEWLPDGGLLAWLDMPAGLQQDLLDDLGKRTHGAAEVKKISEQRKDFDQ